MDSILLARLDQTTAAMSEQLDTLVDAFRQRDGDPLVTSAVMCVELVQNMEPVQLGSLLAVALMRLSERAP